MPGNKGLDVIMPALGMAQETGQIVRWLKSPGDAVKTGDALFEVETDKATMEVEAQGDGFLGAVTAKAGDDVPVGQVIAVIAASADAAKAASGAAPAPAAQPSATTSAEPAPAAKVEGREIIMPALGMAQDSGLIVAWHKAPGDAVADDDVLLEVETDKATMEVPAGASGFIAALYAEAGQDVPVGQVIAVISDTKPENPVLTRAAPGAAKPEAKAASKPEAEKPADGKAAVAKAAPAKSPAAKPAAAATGGRIFASPKARRLAAEAGLDLSRLVAAGYPQPFHAADIETLRALPPEPAPGGHGAVSAARQINASVPRTGSEDFRRWLKAEGGMDLPANGLWLAFAGAALREATGVEDAVVIELASLTAAPRRLSVPAGARIAAPAEADDDASPALVLRDLTGSFITGVTLAPTDAPALSIADEGDNLRLTLDFTAGQLDDHAAIALISGVARRLAEPLRHLL